MSNVRSAARADNSNESQAAELNLVDISSSYPSCGSHSMTLAKKPLEPVVVNLTSAVPQGKTHSSVGFRDMHKLQTMPMQRLSSNTATSGGPNKTGFMSQRISLDTA